MQQMPYSYPDFSYLIYAFDFLNVPLYDPLKRAYYRFHNNA